MAASAAPLVSRLPRPAASGRSGAGAALPAASGPGPPPFGSAADSLPAASSQGAAGPNHRSAAARRTGAAPWRLPLLSDACDVPLPPLPPGASFRQHYRVVVVIDQRENHAQCVPPPCFFGGSLFAASRRLPPPLAAISAA